MLSQFQHSHPFPYLCPLWSALLKRGIRNSGITGLDNIKMANDSYANMSRWRALLPRKVRVSNESKGIGYIDNCLEVVCAEMLLRMKTAANRSFLAQKTRERHRTTHYHSTFQSTQAQLLCTVHFSQPKHSCCVQYISVNCKHSCCVQYISVNHKHSGVAPQCLGQ